MHINDVITCIEKNKVDLDYISEVEKYFDCKLPDEVLRIITLGKEPVFYDECRIVTVKEMVSSNNIMGVDFKEKGIIPLIDVMDNDFIVYSINEKLYYIYNIVEDVFFDKKTDIKEYL